MNNKWQKFELNEDEYLLWNILNLIVINDHDIDNLKLKLIKLLENKMFKNKINKNQDILDSKLYLNLALKEEKGN